MHDTVKCALLALVLACAPAWAINKCKGADGKVVFQDLPCAGQGEVIEVKPASGVGESGPGSYAQAIREASEAHIKALKKINAECDARGVRKLVIGMSSQDALCVPGWRFPKKFNNTTTETLFKQQVVYGGFGKYDDPPKYLYFENGKLTAVQE